MNGKTMMTVAAAIAAGCGAAPAAVSFEKGAWTVAYDGADAKLRLECPARKVSVEGRLSFASNGRAWNVVESRDAAGDRLALVNGHKVTGTVLGYVSFRALGERLEMTVLHRAGANFFPGVLAFDGVADFRADSFPCRTIPATGERVLGSETPGYSLGEAPPCAFNFLHMYLAATGVNLAKRLIGYSLIPEWMWWLWIPDPDNPSHPFYPGFGDDRHDSNRLTSGYFLEHLLQVAHFFRELEPERARLAVTLAGLCPRAQLGFGGQWPLMPFILRADPPLEPYPLEKLRTAKRKARFFPNFGHVFMRSGWTPDSTYAFFGAGCDGRGMHKHYDEGGFVIFKHDFLALDSGSRAAQTDLNLRYYYPHSAAHNVTLVTKPGEPLPRSWGPEAPDAKSVFNDGGMVERTGTVVDFRTASNYTYVAATLTGLYGDKCTENVRQFVHVQPDTFVVYDRIAAADPSWTKRWLLHTQNEPVVTGRGYRADSRDGRLFCEALLPEDATFEKIGGPGREFWSSGRNWPLEESWEQSSRAACERRGRGPYWGAWRMETKPGEPRKEDRFLHVLTATSTNVLSGAAAKRIRTADRDGVELTLSGGRTVRVEFNRSGKVAAEICESEERQ